jgi:GTP-binding protein HflX
VVRRRISQIQEALGDVQRHRRLLRTHRRDVGLSVVALVGHTNAGKTTLLNRIAGANAPTADQLFVTLDPAARLCLGRRPRAVRADGHGRLHPELPTQLVAAFKATLEELEDAQLLLHVVDASHPHAREHMSAVYRVLEELGLEDRPALTVMNKIDRLEEPNGLLRETLAEGGVAVSARTGEGFDALLTSIGEALRSTRSACRLCVPYERGGILSRVYARGRVLGREDRPDGIWLDVEVPRALEGLVRPYRVSGSNGAGARERATTWPVGRGTTLQEAGS